MKRNWYAVILLVLLALLLGGSSLYVRAAAGELRQSIDEAYAHTLAQEYEAARDAFEATVQLAEEHGHWLRLFIRRALVDKLEETITTLPCYVDPDNQADLAVEVARFHAQLEEMTSSFWDGL